jgi:hypothetical protein
LSRRRNKIERKENKKNRFLGVLDVSVRGVAARKM